MTCRINSKTDRCRTHATPAEHMHQCPHDGLVCTCGNPDCHRVASRKVPGPLAKLLPVCALCGPVASATDADGVKEARAAHLVEVAR